MAPNTRKESTLDLCVRATGLGNTISIRMLEYLGTTKQPIQGFQGLANDFLELSRILWSIEAGLAEASRKRNTLPADLLHELDRRFHQINDEFLVLNQMMLKFLDNGKKSGFMKGFRMMFADTDVDKMRTTISKSRDALRMSSAMFRWTLGDAKVEASIGIGYTGLAAALERLNQGRTALSPLQSPPASSPQELSLEPPPENPLPPPPPPFGIAKSSSSAHHTMTDDIAISPRILDRHDSWRVPSTRSSEVTTLSSRDALYNKGVVNQAEPVYEDDSDDAMRSHTFIEGQMHDLDVSDRSTNDATYYKPDSPAVRTWPPRQPASSKLVHGKSALVSCVQLKKHRNLEHLLEGGARADTKVEAGLLAIASHNRDLESISLLLRFGVDPNGADKDGSSPLFTATQTSFYDGAKLLLRYGADPNFSAEPDAESPLTLASAENKIDLVQLYLKHSGDPNALTSSGSTALVQAMNKTTSVPLVEHLLNAGGDPNTKNGEGATALFQAIQANRIDLMALLLDHGADPNLPGPKHPLWPSTYKPKALQLLLSRGADYKKTPGIMELAASLKKLESVSILIKAGVSPNVKKDGTYTPLCSAIRDNSADILSFLLSNGADPNLKASEYPAFKCITHHRTHFLPQLVAAGADLNNPKGILETAVMHSDKNALLYLLERGVSPNDRSPEGNTPLTTAIREDRIEFVELLLSNGADAAIRGQDWPLCMAVKRPAILDKLLSHISNPRAFRGVVEMAVVANEIESIRSLLKAGVSVEDKNCGVFSPLTTAIREDRKHIVRFLLDEAGADPNAPGEHLPIVKALRRYHGSDTEILQMLLARGADINKMHRGWNAVLQAVENGDANVLKLLIDMGGPVDLQATDESGRHVIDIVTERGWEEGLSLLFPSAEARQSTLSLSSWRWLTTSIDRYARTGGDADSGMDCDTESSRTVPVW